METATWLSRVVGSGRLLGMAIAGLLITVGMLGLADGLWENTLLGLVMGLFFMDLLLGHHNENSPIVLFPFWAPLGLFVIALLFIQFSGADLSIIWLLLPLLLLVVLPLVFLLGSFQQTLQRRPLLAAVAMGGIAAAVLRFILSVAGVSHTTAASEILIIAAEEGVKVLAFLAARYYTRKEKQGDLIILALAVGFGFGVQESFVVVLDRLFFISSDYWSLVFLLRLAPVLMHGLATALIVIGLFGIRGNPAVRSVLISGGLLLHATWNLLFSSPIPWLYTPGILLLSAIFAVLWLRSRDQAELLRSPAEE